MRIAAVVGGSALVGASLVAIGAGAEPASAAVDYTVTTTDDADDDGECATDCTLREAVDLAAGDGDDSEVTLPAGTYVLDECDLGEGDLDHAVSEDLTIQGGPSMIVQTCANERVFHHTGNSLLTLSDLTVSGGQAANGGGGAVLLETGSLMVLDSVLHDNEATGGGSGGAIDTLFGSPTVTVIDSTLRDNSAGDTGGAIRNVPGTTVIQRSTIAGNSAASGGAIDGGVLIEIENSTIAGNEARDDAGGGIFASGTVEVAGSTIVDNRATSGGANVHLSSGENSAMTTEGSIIADGRGRPDCGGAGSRTSNGYNVGSDDSCDLDDATDAAGAGPALLAPLVPLSADGGTTPTRVPLAGSPARDHVPNAVCKGASPPVFTTDQRGILRPQPTPTDPCDAGAAEGNADDLVADALVKRKGKPLVGAGVFSGDGAGQKASSKKKRGSTATYTVQVRNASPVGPDVITVNGPPSSGPFRVKYLDGTTDVTGAVTAGTHVTASLPPDANEKLTVKVKVRKSASPGSHLKLLVAADPSSDVPPDAVKIVTKAK